MHPKRVDWRQDAGLTDGGYHKVDLVGGYFVDHDFVKFGFPMASSMTLLAWSVVEFKDAYVASNEYRVAMDTLKWGADYFIKCHTNPFEFYGQVRNRSLKYVLGGVESQLSSVKFFPTSAQSPIKKVELS